MTEQLDASYLIEVRGDEVLRIRDDLDDAVNRAVNHAIKIGRHGVLITQRSYTHYTVALSEEVPYGQTHERWLNEHADAADVS